MVRRILFWLALLSCQIFADEMQGNINNMIDDAEIQEDSTGRLPPSPFDQPASASRPLRRSDSSTSMSSLDGTGRKMEGISDLFHHPLDHYAEQLERHEALRLSATDIKQLDSIVIERAIKALKSDTKHHYIGDGEVSSSGAEDSSSSQKPSKPGDDQMSCKAEFDPRENPPKYWYLSRDRYLTDLPDFDGYRPVNLAVFSIARKRPTNTRLVHKLLGHIEPVHIEVHVGRTAFSIWAVPKKHQQILSRPVEISHVFNRKFVQEQTLHMCKTQKTDLEIYEFLVERWRGIYHMVELNCVDFSKFLTDFLCPDGVDAANNPTGEGAIAVSQFPSKYYNLPNFGKAVWKFKESLKKGYLKKGVTLLTNCYYFGSGETDDSIPWPWRDLGNLLKDPSKRTDYDGAPEQHVTDNNDAYQDHLWDEDAEFTHDYHLEYSDESD